MPKNGGEKLVDVEFVYPHPDRTCLVVNLSDRATDRYGLSEGDTVGVFQTPEGLLLAPNSSPLEVDQ